MSPSEASAATGQELSATPPRPTVAQALLVLAAVVIAIAGYIALSTALGIREAYIGFVFVFYWLSLEQGKAERLPAIIFGACFGLAAAWLLQYALHSSHVALLMALFLAAVAFSIVSSCSAGWHWSSIRPAMLILTVFTIPHIQQAADFPRLYLALAFAMVYFGVFVGLLSSSQLASRPARLTRRRGPRGPGALPTVLYVGSVGRGLHQVTWQAHRARRHATLLFSLGAKCAAREQQTSRGASCCITPWFSW